MARWILTARAPDPHRREGDPDAVHEEHTLLDNDPFDITETGPETGPENDPGESTSPAPEAPEAPAPIDVPQDTPSDTPRDTPEGEGDLGAAKPAKKAAAKKAAKAPAKRAAAKRTTKKTAKSAETEPETDPQVEPDLLSGLGDEPASEVAVDAPTEPPKKKAAPRKRSTRKVAAPAPAPDAAEADQESLETPAEAPFQTPVAQDEPDAAPAVPAAPMVLFKAPEPTTPRKRTTRKVSAKPVVDAEPAPEPASEPASEDDPSVIEAAEVEETTAGDVAAGTAPDTGDQDDSDDGSDNSSSENDSGDGEGGARRRRRRGGRRRRKPSEGSEDSGDSADSGDAGESGEPGEARTSASSGEPGSGSEDDSDNDDESSERTAGDNDADGEGTGSRRRRRRRRSDGGSDDSDNGGNGGSGGNGGNGGGQRARKQRNPEDEITSIGGSTRLEAKKQRRREGREAGRRRAPIVSEAEFLARREAVDRVMVIRQKDDLTQIGVLEDKVLVEHYVARESQTSLIGNVYLGRVQNVLPSMEAAFVDIGKGRNAVLYAGEVNWAAVGHKEGQPRKIESVLSSGQTILVQVSKDPIGHKGARLTGQVSLPGRFLVYVPDGNTSGISRKLPDTERNRLKALLKQIVPSSAGVIVRTAAEGASEEELTLDVERLTARWADIEEKVKAGKSPQLLYGEPDLTLKVVRDLFTEDFAKLVVQGDDAWDLVQDYVAHVAPDLKDRLERFEPGANGPGDLFATYRVDEQIAKGMDRKVWLPSGGSLVIDRTEAMTVVDVNTGKFTGSGGNLEETVTKNNLEAAEEMVRQLRLRDIGGIIVIDFIDMVLESNRDLVLRRLVECLGRDRTRHQVAEVTSLGLVQMTRKRIGTGLLEAFSTDCEACKGRGLVVHEHPVESGSRPDDDDARGRGRGRSGRGRGRSEDQGNGSSGSQGSRSGGVNAGAATVKPSPADLANTRPPEPEPETPVPPKAAEVPAPSVTPEAAPEASEAPEAATAPEAREEPRQSVSVQAPEPAPEQEPVTAPTPESTPEPEPAPEPATPKVVTTTRRRTARRPAGPPTAVAPASDPVAESSVESHGAADGDLGDEADEAGEVGEVDSNGFALSHVPVKRKGSRKR